MKTKLVQNKNIWRARGKKSAFFNKRALIIVIFKAKLSDIAEYWDLDPMYSNQGIIACHLFHFTEYIY
jgi:hypothetical protein